MHILILGATGASGLGAARLALAEGYQITLYVRSPQKLPEDLKSNKDVRIVHGALQEREKLADALKGSEEWGKVEAVLSFLGPLPSWKMSRETPIKDAYESVLYPLLIELGIRRVLVLSTPSFPQAEDKSDIFWTAVIAGIHTLQPGAYGEVVGIGQITVDLPLDKVDWTVARVPFLNNGQNEREVHAGYMGDGKSGLYLSRKSFAQWMLRECKENKWVGKAPLLSNL